MTGTTLTQEQREFAAENHEIVLSYLRGKRLDASEWYDPINRPCSATCGP